MFHRLSRFRLASASNNWNQSTLNSPVSMETVSMGFGCCMVVLFARLIAIFYHDHIFRRRGIKFRPCSNVSTSINFAQWFLGLYMLGWFDIWSEALAKWVLLGRLKAQIPPFSNSDQDHLLKWLNISTFSTFKW